MQVDRFQIKVALQLKIAASTTSVNAGEKASNAGGDTKTRACDGRAAETMWRTCLPRKRAPFRNRGAVFWAFVAWRGGVLTRLDSSGEDILRMRTLTFTRVNSEMWRKR